MRKHELYKSVQLILMLVLALWAILMIFGDSEIYHQVAADSATRIMAVLLWASLVISFVFIYLDFKYFFQYKKEYRELGYAVHSDPVSGINNRFSCDVLIEKYLDKPLPCDMGCIMIDITNIREINKEYGYVQGNMAIRQFSELISDAAEDSCFVGRNGGNKFLAIFESATREEMELFLERLKEKTASYNEKKTGPSIEYRSGLAFHESEPIDGITQLIALSNKRIYQNEME